MRSPVYVVRMKSVARASWAGIHPSFAYAFGTTRTPAPIKSEVRIKAMRGHDTNLDVEGGWVARGDRDSLFPLLLGPAGFVGSG